MLNKCIIQWFWVDVTTEACYYKLLNFFASERERERERELLLVLHCKKNQLSRTLKSIIEIDIVKWKGKKSIGKLGFWKTLLQLP